MPKSSNVKKILFSLFLLHFCLCTSMYQTRTVGKGNTGMELTLGGPMQTSLGSPLPMPNVFVGARYGVLEDIDIIVHYNAFGSIMPGLFDGITAIQWVPVQPGIRFQYDSPNIGPAVGGEASVQWVTDFKNGLLVLPALNIAAGWRYKWFNPFLGIGCGFNFYRPNDQSLPLQLCPYFGTEFLTKKRLGISIKCTFFDITNNFFGSPVEWIVLDEDNSKLKRHAILGLSLGFSYDFGRSE